jgi:LysM repeat protein
MKFYGFLIISIAFFFIAFPAESQQVREDEIIVIQGEKFIIHQVRTRETIYSLEKRFKVDSLELVSENPHIADGLRIGDVIKIPYRENAVLSEQPVHKKGDPSGFDLHTITSRKETPYFIAREYGITVEELYAYNPEVRRFKKGSKLRIPRWDKSEDKQEERPGELSFSEKSDSEEKDNRLIKHEVSRGETLFLISRRYNISVSEILFYNPGARDLKTGSIIYIPGGEERYSEEEPISEEPMESNAASESRFDAESKYFDHTILSGETLWGIAHKYDVPEEELIALNPILEDRFPAGAIIRIPVQKSGLDNPEPVNEDAFIKHLVKPGETLYSIAGKYDMTIPGIRKFNPALEKRNLVAGETILIPRRPDEEIISFMSEVSGDTLPSERPDFESDYYSIELPEEIPADCMKLNEQLFTSEVYDVALFLPLFTRVNDNLNSKFAPPDTLEAVTDEEEFEFVTEAVDTLIEEEESKEMFHSFYQDSENFIQFYEGVLLAVDSMQKAGMRIRLNVYDTERSPESIRKYIYDTGFLKTDLIIGPVYPSIQKEIATIALKNRIPFVSPLSSNSALLQSNQYYYQVNPTRDFLADKTADLIAEEYFNSNFIVFRTGADADGQIEKVIGRVREKLFNSGYWGRPDGFTFNIYDFEREGPFGFSRILTYEKENVIFVPTNNEGDLSIALSNIDNLSDEYPITLIGFNWYQKFNSINIEHFHNLQLKFIAPYWIDYEDTATVRFIKKFKDHYYTEPDNFGIQGYDVAFYFLNAIKRYGTDFNKCLPYMSVKLVQGDYQFEKKARFGGFMNHGVSLISYENDYDIVRKRVINTYNLAKK